MVVRTQSRGRAVSGLRVEAEDVERYFPRTVTDIELHLGELRIHCALAPGFWNGRAQISDHRLCEWLEFKAFHGRPCRVPLSLEMTPIGSGSFKLEPPIGCDLSTCNWPDRVAEGCSMLTGRASNPLFAVENQPGEQGGCEHRRST